jgi:hypothetical protein
MMVSGHGDQCWKGDVDGVVEADVTCLPCAHCVYCRIPLTGVRVPMEQKDLFRFVVYVKTPICHLLSYRCHLLVVLHLSCGGVTLFNFTCVCWSQKSEGGVGQVGGLYDV